MESVDRNSKLLKTEVLESAVALRMESVGRNAEERDSTGWETGRAPHGERV